MDRKVHVVKLLLQLCRLACEHVVTVEYMVNFSKLIAVGIPDLLKEYIVLLHGFFLLFDAFRLCLQDLVKSLLPFDLVLLSRVLFLQRLDAVLTLLDNLSVAIQISSKVNQ